MNYFTKFSLAVAAALTAFGASAFELNGLYYEVSANDDTKVNIVLPPDNVQYYGAVEIPSTVTYEGKTYTVDLNVPGNGSFINSTVTELTLGEGFEFDIRYTPWIRFTYDEYLEKITLKSFIYDYPYNAPYIVTAGKAPATYTNVRVISDNKTEVELVNFEVYGPDGSKLKPFLWIDGKDISQKENRVYPNADGIFELDGDFRYNGQHVMVLPVGSYYYVVVYAVEYNGGYFCIRTQPALYQSGQDVNIDGLTYSISGDHAVVTGTVSGANKTDVTFASSIEYNGTRYPVTEIASKAFSKSQFTSVTFSSSITSVGENAFEYSTNLRSVDMSECDNINFGESPFNGCTSLTDVKLPTAQTSLSSYMFQNCSSLTELEIPETVMNFGTSLFVGTNIPTVALREGMVVNNAFSQTPQLINIEHVENTEPSTISFKVKSNITDLSGNVLPVAAIITYNGMVGYYSGGITEFYYPDSDGVITIPEDLGTYKSYEYSDGYPNNSVTLIYDPRGSYLPVSELNNVNIRSPFSTFRLDAFMGIESVEVAEREAVYYNLHGIRVENPGPGLYIRIAGNTASKVYLR